MTRASIAASIAITLSTIGYKPPTIIRDTIGKTIWSPAPAIHTIIPRDTTNCPSHVLISNGRFIDLGDRTWTENGSVPRVAAESLGFPNGKIAEGAGPFTDAINFQGPASLLALSGPFWITIIYRDTNAAEEGVVVSTGTFPTNGYAVHPQTFTFISFNGSVLNQARPAAGIRVLSFAYSGSGGAGTMGSKMNELAYISGVATAYTPGSALFIGRYGAAGLAYISTFYEMRICIVNAGDAEMTALYNQITTGGPF